MTNRRFGLVLAATAAVATVATPAAAQPGVPFAVKIAHHDLDLANPADQARWLDRVADVAERTCAPHRSLVKYSPVSIRACRALFTEAASRRIADRTAHGALAAHN